MMCLCNTGPCVMFACDNTRSDGCYGDCRWCFDGHPQNRISLQREQLKDVYLECCALPGRLRVLSEACLDLAREFAEAELGVVGCAADIRGIDAEQAGVLMALEEECEKTSKELEEKPSHHMIRKAAVARALLRAAATEGSDQRNRALLHLPPIKRLEAAKDAFNQSVIVLEELEGELGVRAPWHVKFATQLWHGALATKRDNAKAAVLRPEDARVLRKYFGQRDDDDGDAAATPSGGGLDNFVVTFDGGELLDARGVPIWNDECTALGSIIQAGAWGAGTSRYRNLDRERAVCSVEEWQRSGRILQAINRVGIPSAPKIDSVRLAEVQRTGGCFVVRDTQHPVWQRMRVRRYAEGSPRTHASEAEFRLEEDEIDAYDAAFEPWIANDKLGRRISSTLLEYWSRPACGVAVTCSASSWTSRRQSTGVAACPRTHFKLDGGVADEDAAPWAARWPSSDEAPALDSTIETLDEWLSFGDVWALSRGCACALSDLLPEGGGIALCGANSPEWMVVDLAVCMAGGANEAPAPIYTVPLHVTYSVEVLTHGLVKGTVRVLVADAHVVDKLVSSSAEHVQTALEQLKAIVVFDHSIGCNASTPPADFCGVMDQYCSRVAQRLRARALSASVVAWTTLVARGEKIADAVCAKAKTRLQAPLLDEPHDLYTLIFTSGSTGLPKAVSISRSSWLNDVGSTRSFSLPNVWLSWMPSAWGADRQSVWNTLMQGGRVGFAGRPRLPHWMTRLLHVRRTCTATTPTSSCHEADLLGKGMLSNVALPHVLAGGRLFRPSNFLAPPAFWTEMYSLAQQTLGKRLCPAASRQFLNDVLGLHRIALAGSGGAAMSAKIQRWLSEALAPAVLAVGYGATEVGGITSNGKLAPGVQLRLRPVGNMDMSPEDRPNPRGEIVVKRDQPMSSGYHNDEASTSKAFSEGGWYSTGDLGEIVGKFEAHNDGSFTGDFSLRIIGRLGDTFKTARAEWISPGKIESALESTSLALPSGAAVLVSAAFVHGSGDYDAIACVLVAAACDEARVHELASENGTAYWRDREGRAEVLLPSVCVRRSVEDNLRARAFSAHECPDVLLSFVCPGSVCGSAEWTAVACHDALQTLRGAPWSPNLWTPENGLLTGNLKPKRAALRACFSLPISQMLQCSTTHCVANALEPSASWTKDALHVALRRFVSDSAVEFSSGGAADLKGNIGSASFADLGGGSLGLMRFSGRLTALARAWDAASIDRGAAAAACAEALPSLARLLSAPVTAVVARLWEALEPQVQSPSACALYGAVLSNHWPQEPDVGASLLEKSHVGSAPQTFAGGRSTEPQRSPDSSATQAPGPPTSLPEPPKETDGAVHEVDVRARALAACALKEDTAQGMAELARAMARPRRVPPCPGLHPVVLITGAGGFVGMHTVAAVAERMSALGGGEVVCLVRARDSVAAALRMARGMSAAALVEGVYDSEERDGMASFAHPWPGVTCCAVAGDVSKVHLGLDLSVASHLASRISSVINAAAAVNMISPFDALAAVNVGGTTHCLHFLMRALITQWECPVRSSLCHLVHVSTLSVFGSSEDAGFVRETSFARATAGQEAAVQSSPPVAEDFLNINVRVHYPDGLNDGYSQTKWAADTSVCAVWEAWRALLPAMPSLPLRLIRPGFVGWSTGRLARALAELEEETQPTNSDYKFVTETEIKELHLEHLVGTNMLRAYMHGFLIDQKRYNRARRPELSSVPPGAPALNRSDWLTRLVLACAAARVAPLGQRGAVVNITSVDDMATAVAVLALLDHAERGGGGGEGSAVSSPVFHAANPARFGEGSVPFAMLAATMASAGVVDHIVINPDWVALVRSRTESACVQLQPLLDMFSSVLPTGPEYDIQRMEEAWATWKSVHPHDDGALFHPISRASLERFVVEVARHV